MKKDKIIYWITTSLVILMVGLGSFVDLLGIDAIKKTTTSIGFPLYILPLFGTLKLLGTIVILVPKLARFKEAAYAGMVYYFVGATYCHLTLGDSIDKIMTPLFILAMVIVSYVYSNKLTTK